MYYDIYIQ